MTRCGFPPQFLAELKELFVQILLIAQAMGYLQLGNVSLDGSKIHADASKSKAVVTSGCWLSKPICKPSRGVVHFG
ncbi:MAG: hypothetical protein IPM39_16570 [Chloroflexi bacterium]|nr:hypothetical protein [Chloroflexota bacterium]